MEQTFNSPDKDPRQHTNEESQTNENNQQGSQNQGQQQQTKNDLTSKDIPDSTNETTGSTGSGQRQDSN